MKTDVLTLAAVVFVIGLVISSIVSANLFQTTPEPPAALQQGIATR